MSTSWSVPASASSRRAATAPITATSTTATATGIGCSTHQPAIRAKRSLTGESLGRLADVAIASQAALGKEAGSDAYSVRERPMTPATVAQAVLGKEAGSVAYCVRERPMTPPSAA